MALQFEVGRVCVKTAGRESGKHCVIIKGVDDNFVLVTGPKGVTNVKRRKCNVDHLKPLDIIVKIGEDAPDEEVAKTFESEKLYERLNLEKTKRVIKVGDK